MSQMSGEHYKLAVQRFGETPDPRFLNLSATHREAMASVLHGIQSGRGFTALTDARGMSKTTLPFNLPNILKGEVETASPSRKDVEYLWQTRTARIPLSRQAFREIQTALEQNDVTFELAAPRVTP